MREISSSCCGRSTRKEYTSVEQGFLSAKRGVHYTILVLRIRRGPKTLGFNFARLRALHGSKEGMMSGLEKVLHRHELRSRE